MMGIGSISREKRAILLGLPVVLVCFFVLGSIFETHRGVSQLLDIVATLASNILAFAWCRADSRERGYRLHRLFAYSVVIFGTLAFLYYLFRSRGFYGGAVSLGWLVIYVVCSLISSFLVALVLIIPLILFGVTKIDG